MILSGSAFLYTDTQQGELAVLYPEARALAVSRANRVSPADSIDD